MTKEQEKIFKVYLQKQRENIEAGDALAKEVQSLIDDAVAEAAKLGKRLTSFSDFQFNKHPELQKRLDKLCRSLATRMTAAMEQGSKEAWLRANTVNAEVIAALSAGNAQLAADMAAGETKPQNNQALRAFQQRAVAGMNLSDRVWNLTSKTMAQMQSAIEIAIAHGTPAQKLSQEVRQCLQNPDNFFRRFKYKKADEPLFDEHGKPILDSAGKQATRPVYGRKWKMRYTDEDGKTRWKDVDLSDYRYGSGVYRSAYKNAMRLARTEINMAYHASDAERWSSTWWVKGIRISLSNNHTTKDGKGEPQPLVDICDDLAGDYPPDFKFTGWHPQCRCFAFAITASKEEIREYHRRKRAGEDMSGYQVPGKITTPPDAFKRWVEDNSARFEKALRKGKAPYFVAENAKYAGAKFATKTKLSIQECAAARHAARSEEDIERTQLAWDARRREQYEKRMADELTLESRNKIKTDLYDVDCGMFGDHNSNRRILDGMRRKLDTHKSNLNLWNDLVTTTPNKRKDVIPDFGKLDMFNEKTSAILRAAKRHAARTDKEIELIITKWDDRRLVGFENRIKDATAKGASKPELRNMTEEFATTITRPYLWEGLSRSKYAVISRSTNDIELEKLLRTTKGSPMNRILANNGRENPRYNSKGNKKHHGYSINCQTCTMTHEMRRRGFNVEALPSMKDPYKSDEGEAYVKLARAKVSWTERFLNADGTRPKYQKWQNYKLTTSNPKPTIKEFIKYSTAEEGRYEIYCQWKDGGAHVFCCERSGKELVYFDPQTGKIGKTVENYISHITNIHILRIDDKIINPICANLLKVL